MSKPIARLYYYEELSGQWYLTVDKQLAAQGYDFRSGNLDDLDDFGAVGGIISDKIVQVDEGFFEWNPTALVDGFGDTYGDYVLVSDLKERVLDRMEQLDMENTIEYENLVGVSEYKVYSWVDLNEINL